MISNFFRKLAREFFYESAYTVIPFSFKLIEGIQIIVAFRFKLTEGINKKHLAIKKYFDYGSEFVPNFIQMKFELFGRRT